MKSTISSEMKEKFFNEGNVLPECVNHGCSRKVLVREWKYWSFKVSVLVAPMHEKKD